MGRAFAERWRWRPIEDSRIFAAGCARMHVVLKVIGPPAYCRVDELSYGRSRRRTMLLSQPPRTRPVTDEPSSDGVAVSDRAVK